MQALFPMGGFFLAGRRGSTMRARGGGIANIGRARLAPVLPARQGPLPPTHPPTLCACRQRGARSCTNTGAARLPHATLPPHDTVVPPSPTWARRRGAAAGHDLRRTGSGQRAASPGVGGRPAQGGELPGCAGRKGQPGPSLWRRLRPLGLAHPARMRWPRCLSRRACRAGRAARGRPGPPSLAMSCDALWRLSPTCSPTRRSVCCPPTRSPTSQLSGPPLCRPSGACTHAGWPDALQAWRPRARRHGRCQRAGRAQPARHYVAIFCLPGLSTPATWMAFPKADAVARSGVAREGALRPGSLPATAACFPP